MRAFALFGLVVLAVSMVISASLAQQAYRLPDLRSMKLLTSKASDRDPEIPGKETTMDFYSGAGGQIVTVYRFRGRTVAFSTHNNSDVQNSYRLYLDMNGNGLFQQIPGNSQWRLPPWAR